MVLSMEPHPFFIELDLPASKSIYNRLKIINEVYNLNLTIENPSQSGDSLLLNKLLASNETILNCDNAGTVIRFLTAYYAIISKAGILTGNDRMKSRPIIDLVSALNSLGASIEYLEKDGFAPIKISKGLMKGGTIPIAANVSSQFVSALAMIGPKLKNGLEINIKGPVSSSPYIDMSINLMKIFGFEIERKNLKIICKPWSGKLLKTSISIEPDWSAVAFWFQIVSLNPNGKVVFKNLIKNSLQGDSILISWANKLGLKITSTETGLILESTNIEIEQYSEWNFTNHPDLAPSIIVLLSAQKKKATFIGLETLQHKESNRILALKTELKKCGVGLIQIGQTWQLDATNFELPENLCFQNYEDHRMAMALATLSILNPIQMENLETVEKSYPDFWKHLGKTGNFKMQPYKNKIS